ncbi:MAG: CHAT domain-containing protein [Holophagales bacterium]|nr:CHAT domain-containing protein [Holophagales bacterium]
MPEKRGIEVRCEPPPGWAEAGPRRAIEPDALAERLSAGGRLALAGLFRLLPLRGAGEGGTARIVVPEPRGADFVVVLRQPSGALSMHRPASRPAPDGGPVVLELPILARTGVRGERRGVRAAVVLVLRAKVRVEEKAVATLGRAFEEAAFRRAGLVERLVHVTPEGLAEGRLAAASPSLLAPPPERNLLLLHGTFSHTAAAFADLARGGFFEALAPLYGGRVFGFDHFTVSRTPEENARMFAEALPGEEPFLFDVVAHSRGGLVLRTLLERPAEAGPAASRFACGRAVLAAVPNLGTPLASSERWDLALSGWLNLFDLLPPAPAPLLGEFVVEALLWFARRVTTSLAGLSSMDGRGGTVAAFERSAVPEAYSALAASHHASGPLALRLLESGVDRFFGEPHDLVVPTQGCFVLDRASGAQVADERVALFGSGGRLGRSLRRPAHHLDLFAREEAVAFLVASLAGETFAQAGRQARRSATRGTRIPAALKAGEGEGKVPGARRSKAPKLGGTRREALELTLLPGDRGGVTALLLARYGTARVVAEVPRKGAAWREIIRGHERLRACFDGDGRPLPSGAALERWGTVLFETLLPGEARRLWDAARGAAGGSATDVVFTSLLDWVADKPWELAYDPHRRAWLAATEANFTRNVVTAIPCEVAPPRRRPLAILVVAAQPAGLATLSWEAEAEAVHAGLAPLVAKGLARVRVERAVTVEALHRLVADGPCDVLHFIGHGTWDAERRTGSLLLESAEGGVAAVEATALRALLSGRGLSLVVLNACLSARGSRGDLARGVAPALVAAGIPAVVANQFSVLDAAALVFARELYRSLALGRPLGDATREARLAVRCDAACGPVDWAVPVVYARDPGAVL